jgi:rubrerythrin
MKLIAKLVDRIEDEIDDVKFYAKLASEVKDTHPSLAHVLYTISVQEDAHHAALHAEVVKIIEQYRKEHGEPPAAMMAVYEYEHRKMIEKMAEARRYQEIYRTT